MKAGNAFIHIRRMCEYYTTFFFESFLLLYIFIRGFRSVAFNDALHFYNLLKLSVIYIVYLLNENRDFRSEIADDNLYRNLHTYDLLTHM